MRPTTPTRTGPNSTLTSVKELETSDTRDVMRRILVKQTKISLGEKQELAIHQLRAQAESAITKGHQTQSQRRIMQAPAFGLAAEQVTWE